MSLLILHLIKILIIILLFLIGICFLEHAKKKQFLLQRERGVLEPMSNEIKRLVKEAVLPSSSNKFIFSFSPMLTFVISLIGWAVIPFNELSIQTWVHVGFLYIFGESSFVVYGIFLSCRFSNSVYAFFQAIRLQARLISFELTIAIIILTISIIVGSFDLTDIVDAQRDGWFIIQFFPLFLLFFASSIAIINRQPFDLPEAESELVLSYNVENSGMGIGLLSFGEYANMLMMSSLNVILFWGGYLPPFGFFSFIPGIFLFGLKTCLFVILFVVMKAAIPRYRYDQLMGLAWKAFVPYSTLYLIISWIIVIFTSEFPFL